MQRKISSLSVIRALGLALVLGATASCSEEPNNMGSKSNTLTILVPDGEERLTGPAWDDDLKMLVYLPLVKYDYDNCPGDPTGGLADRLEPSEDSSEWTVYLRRDIRWHDGEPVTAHDIKFTVDLWNHPDVNYYAGGDFGEVTVLDDYTFRVTYSKPSRALLGGWAVFYPRHLLKDLPPAEFMNWDFWTRPVGNGPYRYVHHTKRTMMEFEANPDFYLGKPKIEKLILKFGADGASGVAELKGGTVDVRENFSPTDAFALRDIDDVRLHFGYTPARIQISWNHRFPLFADARVRRALTHAIDRRALHRALNLPANLPLTDGLYTDCQFTRGEFPAPLPYDPALSRTLLAEAGWNPDDDGKLRAADGRLFSFTLLAEQKFNTQAAVFIQSQLRDLGVEMKIQPLQSATIRENVESGNFEAALHKLGASASFHHRPFFSGNSPIGYQNDVVDALYAGVYNSIDRAEWDAAYVEISEIFRKDVPVTFLFPRVRMTAASRRIKGYTELDSRGTTDFNIAYDIHKYWLEDQ
ncbi:MAG: hypothetical protein IIB77_01415 [Proteobacteria bacterium]|nr:hypothetical protein [Pseudomonadota bacterium]